MSGENRATSMTVMETHADQQVCKYGIHACLVCARHVAML